jgi:hypothetical protein
LIPDLKQPVKILGDGEFTKKLTVTAGWYSKTAHEKITKAGGAANNLKGAAFEFPKPKRSSSKRDKPAAAAGGGKKKKGGDAEEGVAPAADAPKSEAPKTDAPAAE